jgi:hypothetical protein
MSHERKKDGERKDKKNKRMHESVAFRQAMAEPEAHRTDEKDVVTYKPGSARDKLRHQPPPIR